MAFGESRYRNGGMLMEKLILKCGRFEPSREMDTESRLRAMEGYLARLAEEMEFLISEIGRTLEKRKEDI